MTLQRYMQSTHSLAPLAFFRIVFGAVTFLAMMRFFWNGWIVAMYIQPSYHFHFWGLSFIQPIGIYTYGIFILCAASALGIALGYRYKISTIFFLLSFIYIEAMDVAYYLNHYYFIIAIGFLLLFLPANRIASLDVYFGRVQAAQCGPRFFTDVPRLMMSILYFYAGLAKVNSDWLLNAMPLKMWLPAKYDLPIVGAWVDEIWLAYAFSWFGCLYDLTIWIFLWWGKTRKAAYFFVVSFHLATAIFFPAIGMFPYIMIALSTVFFTHPQERIFKTLGWWPVQSLKINRRLGWSGVIIVLFLFFQILFPLRGFLYPGELFWHEQGFRFSWRVMLMEKSGSAMFTVVSADGRKHIVNNTDFLTYTQEKQMATQPDLILQFGQYLGDYYQEKGFKNPSVFVESHVTLHARKAQALIDPNVDLMTLSDGWSNKTWIVPLNDTIHGF